MVAAGFFLAWLSYSGGLFGWCMFRGYNVTIGQLMSPAHPYGSGKGEQWPPPPMPDTQIWPGNASAAQAASSAPPSQPSSGSGPAGQGVNSSGGCPPGSFLIGGKCVQGAAM